MKQFENLQILSTNSIDINMLLMSPAKLTCLTGDIGLENKISSKNLYRPQLAIAGYVGLFNYDQIQVFGNTEYFYLNSLNKKDRLKAFKNISQFSLPCIIITNNHQIDDSILKEAIKKKIPILTTPYETTKLSYILSEFLDDQFAPQAVIHGSFMDVYGVGILFVGRSGIGKSEIALDLVERGHRLVADDVVMLTKKRETILMGTGTSMVQHFMEIRGLGIIDVRQMFGIRAIRFQKRLELIVKLEEWKESAHYTRTGLDEEPANIMGVDIQHVMLPIFSGKNVTVIAEVIALNYLLRTYGYNPAKILSDKLSERLKSQSGPSAVFKGQRIINNLQGDVE